MLLLRSFFGNKTRFNSENSRRKMICIAETELLGTRNFGTAPATDFVENGICHKTVCRRMPASGKRVYQSVFLTAIIRARIIANGAPSMLSMAPIFAAPWIAGSVNASPATKSATVKPIPAMTPAMRSSR